MYGIIKYITLKKKKDILSDSFPGFIINPIIHIGILLSSVVK